MKFYATLPIEEPAADRPDPLKQAQRGSQAPCRVSKKFQKPHVSLIPSSVAFGPRQFDAPNVEFYGWIPNRPLAFVQKRVTFQPPA